jgi:hypothetical protein
MSNHMMDNFIVSDWFRLTDCAKFNNVPFGVYAMTEPTDMIPLSGIKPHEYDRTIYFGKSGVSYYDFLYDRKNVKRRTSLIGEQKIVSEKEHFHRYSLPARRLKDHRHNLMNENTDVDRETSYIKFYESFGYGSDVVSKINVCMITPLYEIPNHSVKAWLYAIESYLILKFQFNFGRNTLMNIDHDFSYTGCASENSHNFRKKEELKNNNLFRFFDNA